MSYSRLASPKTGRAQAPQAASTPPGSPLPSTADSRAQVEDAPVHFVLVGEGLEWTERVGGQRLDREALHLEDFEFAKPGKNAGRQSGKVIRLHSATLAQLTELPARRWIRRWDPRGGACERMNGRFCAGIAEEA